MHPAHTLHTVPLDPRVTLVVHAKTFYHADHGLQPPTSRFGRWFGRPARSPTIARSGFVLQLTNNEQALRSYYFSMALYADREAGVIRTTVPRHVAHLGPGQTVEVDLELDHPADFHNAYLMDFVIAQGNQQPLAQFMPRFPLALAAEPHGRETRNVGLAPFYALVMAELGFVALTTGMVLHEHYGFSSLSSWLASIAGFLIGGALCDYPRSRAFLCGFLACVWGFFAYQYLGFLGGAGAMALAWLVHKWLRQPLWGQDTASARRVAPHLARPPYSHLQQRRAG